MILEVQGREGFLRIDIGEDDIKRKKKERILKIIHHQRR
jgi:hypothetical protein